MRKIQIIGLSLLILASCKNEVSEYTIAIGTYTRKEGHVDGKAQGIYLLNQNAQSGILTITDTIVGTINPSYLVVHPEHKSIYAVSEIAESSQDNIGLLSAYVFDKTSHQYELKNQVSSEGDAPCHILLDPTGQYAITSNYMGGVSVHRINQDLGLSPSIDRINHVGGDTLSVRQEASHPHMAAIAPDGQNILIVDLGINAIVHYRLVEGDLQYATTTPTSHKGGPRHVVVHPDNGKVYLINELANNVEVLQWESIDKPMKSVQILSTLHDPYLEGISSSAIHLHPNKRFLYAANRSNQKINKNSIAAFKINEKSGWIELIEIQPTNQDTPRDFSISPDGKFLQIAHQNSNNIVTYKIEEDGSLTDIGQMLELPTPVCLKYF
jgi:6-phosphogluconolactonase